MLMLGFSVLRGLSIRCNCVAVPEALGVISGRVSAHRTAAASRERRGGTAGPVVGVRLWLKLLVDVKHAVASAVLGIANLDVVVVPAELLVSLDAGEEVGAAEEVADTGDCWIVSGFS